MFATHPPKGDTLSGDKQALISHP